MDGGGLKGLRIRLSRDNPGLLLFLGLLVRETFSFWTGHPWDFEVWIRNAYFVGQGMNPYAYFPPVPGLSFAYLGGVLPSVGYLPLWSLLLGVLARLYLALSLSSPFLFYFLLKQPEILGDVALGYAIFRIVLRDSGDASKAVKALAGWMFFPYVIIISAIWGQFDSLVAFLWLASLLLVSPTWKGMAQGLGVLLKFFPLLDVPYSFLRERRWKRWDLALTVGIPVIFTMLAYLVFGWNPTPLNETLVFELRGHPGGMTYTNLITWLPFIPDAVRSGFFAVMGLAWIPAIAYASYFASRKFPGRNLYGSVQAGALLLTVFYLSRAYTYEQYLIYLLAFLSIDLYLWHPERRSLFRATWVLALTYLLWNNDFMIRFVGPSFPASFYLSLAFDANPVIGSVRLGVVLVLNVLITAQLVQVLLVIANPSRSTVPWVLRLLSPIRWARNARVTPSRDR